MSATKFFCIIFLAILLIGVVSAAEWDNVKTYDTETKQITLYNYNLIGMVFDIKLAEYKLIDNTDQCLINCEANGIAVLYTDEQLFQDMNFYDKKEIAKEISHQILILVNETYEVEVPDEVKEVCNDVVSNKTGETEKECYNETISYKKEERQKEVWQEYKGEVLTTGTYQWKLKGTKSVSQSVDWIGTTFGKDLKEWSWWNSSWEYKQAINVKENDGVAWNNYTVLIPVTYDDDMNADFSDLRFTNGDEDTELGYWIQNKTDSTSANVWVNVSLTANVNTTIYMYYGNAGASTSSSRANVFTKPTSNAHGKTLGGSTSGALDNSRGYYITAFSPMIILNYTKTAGTNCEQINLYEVGTTNSLVNISQSNNAIYKIANTTQFNLLNANADGSSCDFNYGNFGGYPVNTSNVKWTNGDAFYSGTHHTDVNGFAVLSLITDVRAVLEPTVYFGSEESADTTTSTLNSPIAYANLTDKDVEFNCTGTSKMDDPLANVSLIINGTYNNTNSSPTNATPVINIIPLADGYYNWTCSACDSIGCNNATERTFWVNTAPTIYVESPPANTSNYTTDTIYINASASLPIGTWIANYNGTNITLSDINTSLTIEDGNHHLLLYGNNSDSGVWGLNDTYYFNVDATPPAINITYPIGTISYHKNNTNLTLNYTASDTNIDSCWFEYEGVNTSLNCSETTYPNMTITNSSARTIILWANDTFGNEVSDTQSWDYGVYFNNETYETPAYVTDTTDFTFSFWHNSASWTSVSVMFYYDGTSYSTTVSGSGDYLTCNKSLSLPSTGNKTFYWGVNLSNSTTTLNVTTDSQEQEVLAVAVSLCNATENPYLKFNTVSTNLTHSVVNATFQSSWEVRINNESTSYSTGNLSDLTETNNTWYICIEPNDRNYTIDAIIEADGSTFSKTFYYLADAEYSNITNNITLYMVEDSLSDLVELRVYDMSQQAISNAIIQCQKYDVGTDTYYTVQVGMTTELGTDVVPLEWYETLYKFVVIKDGEVLGTFGPQKVSETPITFTIGENTTWSWTKFEDFVYSLTYNNVTENFILTFTKPSGLVDKACLKVEKVSGTNDTVICNSCETSSSATVYCNIGGWGNGTYIATFYATGSFKVIDYLQEIVGGDFSTTINTALGTDDANFYAFLFAGISVALFLISPVLAIIALTLSLLACSLLGFTIFNYFMFFAVAIVGGIIIVILKMK